MGQQHEAGKEGADNERTTERNKGENNEKKAEKNKRLKEQTDWVGAEWDMRKRRTRFIKETETVI